MATGQPAHLAGWPWLPSVEGSVSAGGRNQGAGGEDPVTAPGDRRSGGARGAASGARSISGGQPPRQAAGQGAAPGRNGWRSQSPGANPRPPAQITAWGRQPDGGGGARGGEGASRRGFAPDNFVARRPNAAPTASAGRRACARPPTGSKHPLSAGSIIDQAAGQGEPRRRARRRSSQRARPVSERRMSPTW